MQDKYISLDPQHADSTSAGVRRALWRQRIVESKGGDARSIVGIQAAMTGGLLTWANFRAKGFRMMPFTASKIPQISAIAGMSAFGWFVGSTFVANKAGNPSYKKYLIVNKGKIMSGEVSME